VSQGHANKDEKYLEVLPRLAVRINVLLELRVIEVQQVAGRTGWRDLNVHPSPRAARCLDRGDDPGVRELSEVLSHPGGVSRAIRLVFLRVSDGRVHEEARVTDRQQQRGDQPVQNEPARSGRLARFERRPEPDRSEVTEHRAEEGPHIAAGVVLEEVGVLAAGRVEQVGPVEREAALGAPRLYQSPKLIGAQRAADGFGDG